MEERSGRGADSARAGSNKVPEIMKLKGVGPMAQLNVEQQHMAADRAAN